MNHAINSFNKITILGKERAERTIFSVLGNLIRNDWKGKVNDIYYDRSSELKGLASYDRALEEEEFEQEAFENVDPEDLFAGSGYYEIREMAMKIMAHVYCDNEYDDKKLGMDLLELKQAAERLKV